MQLYSVHDSLLKPFSKAGFHDAINKLKERVAISATNEGDIEKLKSFNDS